MEKPSAEDWMAGVDDDVHVSSLSIPGTHNSGACFRLSAPSVRCQGASIEEQLAHGVRYLDLRVSKDYMSRGERVDDLIIVHGKLPVRLSGTYKFKSVLEDVHCFLRKHPTETVLISLKFENTMLNWNGDSDEFAKVLFQRYIAHSRDRWYLSDKIPTLKYCRGKAVLLRRFPVLENGVYKRFGIPCTWNSSSPIYNDPHVCVQDYFEVKTPADLDKKSKLIKSMMAKAQDHHHHRRRQHPPHQPDSIGGSDSSAAAASSSLFSSSSESSSTLSSFPPCLTSPSCTSSAMVPSGSSSSSAAKNAKRRKDSTASAEPWAPKLFINFCSGASVFSKQFWPSNVEKMLRKHNLDKHYGKGCGIVVLDFAERDDWKLVDKLFRVNFT